MTYFSPRWKIWLKGLQEKYLQICKILVLMVLKNNSHIHFKPFIPLYPPFIPLCPPFIPPVPTSPDLNKWGVISVEVCVPPCSDSFHAFLRAIPPYPPMFHPSLFSNVQGMVKVCIRFSRFILVAKNSEIFISRTGFPTQRKNCRVHEDFSINFQRRFQSF